MKVPEVDDLPRQHDVHIDAVRGLIHQNRRLTIREIAEVM